MALVDLIKRYGGLTESYWFYTNSDNPVELRYDPRDHVYLLVTEDGTLEKQDGVTTVVHVIDKSNALVPWACKMMYQKALRTLPESVNDTYIFTFEELDKWVHGAKDGHKDKLEEAGDIGHIAHAWIEEYIKMVLAEQEATVAINKEFFALAKAWWLENMPSIPQSASCCRAALDWMQTHSVKWISTERKIYSRKHKYAGTMDGLCYCSSCTDSHCCPEPFTDRLTVADWKTSNYLYLEYVFQTAAYEAAYEEETGEDVLDRWIIRLGKEDAAFDPWHLEEHNFEDDFGGFLDCLALVRRVRRIEGRIAAKKADQRAAVKAERDAARAVKEAAEKAEKAVAKEKAQQERLEALARACGASKKYKGLKKPSCKTNNGGPCDACVRIYQGRQGGKRCESTTSTEPIPTLSSSPDRLSTPEALLAVLTPQSTTQIPTPESKSLMRIEMPPSSTTPLTDSEPIVPTIGQYASWWLSSDKDGNAILVPDNSEPLKE